ncbi:hypothetical protein [Kingella potus]|uniref:hypothetical protein n=1 Tax=Kingella potus TaxID=265175 RepID=UPI001FD4762E|nr:hypothetical protein [Kingella potus]UOP01264.1 hypothetical protein LVJ84_03105 [Kingella potus]
MSPKRRTRPPKTGEQQTRRKICRPNAKKLPRSFFCFQTASDAKRPSEKQQPRAWLRHTPYAD